MVLPPACPPFSGDGGPAPPPPRDQVTGAPPSQLLTPLTSTSTQNKSVNPERRWCGPYGVSSSDQKWNVWRLTFSGKRASLSPLHQAKHSCFPERSGSGNIIPFLADSRHTSCPWQPHHVSPWLRMALSAVPWPQQSDGVARRPPPQSTCPPVSPQSLVISGQQCSGCSQETPS